MKLLSELYTQTHPGARVYNQGATWCVYTDEKNHLGLFFNLSKCS